MVKHRETFYGRHRASNTSCNAIAFRFSFFAFPFSSLCPQLRRSWRGILFLGRSSVHPSVRWSRFLMYSITLEPCMLLFWKLLIWVPHEKIADTYFFLTGLCPFPELWLFQKNLDAFYLVSKISQKLLELEPWKLVNGFVVISRWSD